MNSDETKDIYTFKCLFAMHLIYETLPKICPKFLLTVLLCLVKKKKDLKKTHQQLER
jgi:peptide subunit release factor RF-3